MNVDILPPTLGGILIGLAAGGLYVFNGRMAGISSILGESLRLDPVVSGWRWNFLAGLLAGGFILTILFPSAFPRVIETSFPVVVVGGVLVGLGARVGGGCTSGHGVCGLAHLSGSSLVATLTFMVSAAATVLVVRHLLGGLA